MNFLEKHPYPVEAWISVASGLEPPDIRIQIENTTLLPDQCHLTFTYKVLNSREGLEVEEAEIDAHKDFYVGEKPTLIRKFLIQNPKGSSLLLVVEFKACHESVIYREFTKTLYVCSLV